MYSSLRIILRLLLTVSLAPGAVLAAEPAPIDPATFDLEAMFDALEAPTIVGEVPTPAKLVVGHAEIQPLAGARLFLLSAEDRPCGYLLDGPASWSYRIERDEGLPMNEQMLSEAKGVKAESDRDGILLTGKLEGVAAWGWGLDTDLGEPSPVVGKTLPSWLVEALDQDESSNPSRDMTQALLNGNRDAFRWLLLHGKDNFVLDVDSRPTSRIETLSRFDKITSGALSGRFFHQRISRQPIDRTWPQAAEVGMLSLSTQLTVKNPRKDFLEVTSRTEFESARDGLRLLPLRLATRILDERQRLHPYTIQSLAIDGQPAPFVHRNGGLNILLPKPLGPGGRVTLDLTVSGEVIVRPQGDRYWRLGFWNWYPKPSHGEELSTFDLTFETLPPFVPFAPGKLIERTSSPEANRVVSSLEVPMNDVFLVAGEYTTVEQKMDDKTIYASAYNFSKDKESLRVLQIMFAARTCFENWFGLPYPFEDLQVVEVNQWGWGQAPAGFIFLTKEAFLSSARVRADAEARNNAFLRRSLDARITHELAHAYFPHVAKVWRGEENWLSESLSDYTAAVCVSALAGDRPSLANRLFNDQLIEWKGSSKEVENGSVFFANYQKNNPQGRRDRRRLLYGRGPLAIHAIRLQLQESKGVEEGDSIFLSWLRSYVNIFKYKRAETQHLIRILEKLSGDDWQPFFERHIYGTEHVEIDD